MSDRQRERQAERKRNLLDAYGQWPDCAGWGILPTCRTVRPHPADDGHEPGMRSRGADPRDSHQVLPLCRDGHDWVTDHPAQAAQLRTRDGRPFLEG